MMKKFKEDNLGHVHKGAVCVNVEMIWDLTKSEIKFIREFAKTYTHELLHILLASALEKEIEDVPEVAEEEVIRAMLGEEWDKELEAMYMERALA